MNHIIAAIVTALALSAAGGVDTGYTYSGTEEGENGLCLDYNLLYEVDGVHEAVYDVTGGAEFTATQEGGAALYIDWYDAEGAWVSWTDAGSGIVPGSAAFASFCVGLIGDFYPDVPAVGATWTYTEE